MTKSEKAKLDALDKMLDRWAEHDQKYGVNLKPISDPKPGWDHMEYQNFIYSRGLNK